MAAQNQQKLFHKHHSIHTKLLRTSIKDVTWASTFSACTCSSSEDPSGGRPIGPIKLEGWAFLLALATAKLELWGHSSFLEIESCSSVFLVTKLSPRGNKGGFKLNARFRRDFWGFIGMALVLLEGVGGI